MFAKKTVKAFSIVAIVLSAIGLLLSILAAVVVRGDMNTFRFMMAVVSWVILLWASIIGYRLCTAYKLYDEEYKKVGMRIYAIIIAFVFFLFLGLIVGCLISIVIFAALWGLKRNYDDWESMNPVLELDAEKQERQNDSTTSS